MKSVAQAIEKIRTLAGEAARVDVELDTEHGIDRSLGIRHDDPKGIARRHATNRAETELEEYLLGLDPDTLRRVEAVMYSGRGDGPATDMRQQLGSKTRSDDDVVRTIIEKRVSFDPYFERGLARAKADGVDLDSF